MYFDYEIILYLKWLVTVLVKMLNMILTAVFVVKVMYDEKGLKAS